MAHTPPLPLAAIAPVRQTIQNYFASSPFLSASDGRHLLDRLAPERWGVEWALPFWFGHHYGLPALLQTIVAEAAIFGLAYVRLTDDIQDGDGSLSDKREATALAADCLHQAQSRLRRVLPDAGPFWSWLAQTLATWQQTGSRAAPADIRRATAVEISVLAERAAPQLIVVAALATLTGRPERQAAWRASLHPLATADVLFDHLVDWPADVDDGRYNAFVAWCNSSSDPDPHPSLQRQQVLKAMGGSGGADGYFALIHRFIGLAHHEAMPLACNPYTGYLAWFDGHVTDFERDVTHRTRSMLISVGQQLAGAFTGLLEDFQDE